MKWFACVCYVCCAIVTVSFLNQEARKCGGPELTRPDAALLAGAAWPALIGLAIAFRDPGACK